MYCHQNSLQHLLRPEDYFQPEYYAREIGLLFRPAWHFICAKSELPKHGDFLTLDLLGTPLQIRNSGGVFLAYENICCHRHCLLTSAATGNQPTLRCQYHGWEFDDRGSTARIPEAKSFRPWDRENSRLQMFRVECCGDLIFVTLDRQAPPLRDWMDPFFEETERAFSGPQWRMTGTWEYDCNSNWKVPVENTLESYHVTTLHPAFFGSILPPEENAAHILSARHTALTFSGTSRLESLQAWFHRWLGGAATLQYRHRHIHPATVIVSTDTINYALMYLPLSPTRVRLRYRFFAFRGTRRGPHASAASWLAWRYGLRKTKQVHEEDKAVYESQQKGLERSRHPGVIGAREERVYAFQKYVLETTRLSVSMPSTEPRPSVSGPLS